MDINANQKRIAIHEASHAVVAKLFDHELHLSYITLSPERLQQHSNKGITVGSNWVVPKTNDSGVSTGVVSLAGMIGEKIWTDGPANACANKAALLANPNTIDKQLTGGDYEVFSKNSSVCAWKYGTIDDYEHLCITFLLDFLCNEKVWPIVEHLSQKLLQKGDLTLYEQELEAIFKTTGYADYIKDQKTTLLEPFEQTVDINSPEYQLKKLLSSDSCDIFSLEGGENSQRPAESLNTDNKPKDQNNSPSSDNNKK